MNDVTHDLDTTLEFRSKLSEKKNLLYWYRQLFQKQMQLAGLNIENSPEILEVGSGASPFKEFYPKLKTSDVQQLDYLDYVFDAHYMDECSELNGKKFDAIIMCNVLHHLERPLDFLQNASKYLKSDGKIIITEPWFSILSNLIYRYIHHEPVDSEVNKPELETVSGPLSSANIILPQLIFFKRRDWLVSLDHNYDIEKISPHFYTGLSYFATGGMRATLPIPRLLYVFLFQMDTILARLAPRLWSSFFTVVLASKTKP